jgi:hypothetical protein
MLGINRNIPTRDAVDSVRFVKRHPAGALVVVDLQALQVAVEKTGVKGGSAGKNWVLHGGLFRLGLCFKNPFTGHGETLYFYFSGPGDFDHFFEVVVRTSAHVKNAPNEIISGL